MNYINNWSLDEFQEHLDVFVGSFKGLKIIDSKIAGEGNMNYAIRLFFENSGSIIIKQSPPYCAKFEDIPAPENRIFAERDFYKIANTSIKVKKFSPQILGFDSDSRIMYMTDLGVGSDFDFCYDHTRINKEALDKLVGYLNSLHLIDCAKIEFENFKMRELNHAYIFDLPFNGRNNAINLDEVTHGLTEISEKLRSDVKLQEIIIKLGHRYHNEGDKLVHGDFYPRSWLTTNNGLFVIDPEFGFKGLAEFDLGVFCSHLAMSAQLQSGLSSIKDSYYLEFDNNLMLDFCAVEILRRLLYVSQLPVVNDIEFKLKLINASVRRLKDNSYLFEDIK